MKAVLSPILLQTKKGICSDMISDTIKNAEGVYFNIVNIENADPLRKHDFSGKEDFMIVDNSFSLLTPPETYIDLVTSLKVHSRGDSYSKMINGKVVKEYVKGKLHRITREDCLAKVTGISRFINDRGFNEVFFDIEGGSYNPHIKYKSNKSSSSRRLKLFDNLSYVVDGKIVVMNLNLTFPKVI